MTSKRHEADAPNLWFPARTAPQAILAHFNKRSRTIELTVFGGHDDQTYRISLHDFLFGMGACDLALDECRRAGNQAGIRAARAMLPMLREHVRRQEQQP